MVPQTTFIPERRDIGNTEIGIIRSFEDAIQIGSKYLTGESSSRKHMPKTIIPTSNMDGPWAMDLTALTNTLSYVMNFLHHSCYMLCLGDGGLRLYKLETRETSPFLQKILLNDLNHEDRIIAKSLFHPNGNLKDLRVMQCIVKPFAEESNTAKEYATILNDIGNLPAGVYILNLTDAVILRKDKKFPWQMVTKKDIPPEFAFNTFLPIFSISCQEGYWDLPFPNYDDINIALTNPIQDVFTEWSKKPYNKAVFRGGPTGCGYKEDSNMRIRIAQFGNQRGMRVYIDAGIVHPNVNKRTIDTQSIKYDPIHGIGYMKTNIPSVDKMTMKGQSEYKYIIHLDGNVNAYRLLNMMRTGSLILRVKSPYLSWADSLLKPNEHYIEVKDDLSDLLDKIRWCNRNDAACEVIAKNAMRLAKKILTRPFIESVIQSLLWNVYNTIQPATNSIENANKDNHRCPKGTRKNKNGACENRTRPESPPIPVLEPIILKDNPKPKQKRCPKGTRKAANGDCLPMK